MRLEDVPATAPAQGLGGALRLIATLLIGVVATLGVLVVFDILPRGLFETYAGKIGWATGIIVLSVAAIFAVSRLGRAR